VTRIRDHYLCNYVTLDNGDRALIQFFSFGILLDFEHPEVQLAVANLSEEPAVSIFNYKIWCSTSVTTTLSHNLQDKILNFHRHENLKFIAQIYLILPKLSRRWNQKVTPKCRLIRLHDIMIKTATI
jgi:hypothetical protein